MNIASSHLLQRRIFLVRFGREPRTNNPSTISKIIRLRSIGLPDTSGSIVGPSTLARLSQVDRARVLAMNSHTYGIQIHQDDFSGLKVGIRVATGGAASEGTC